MAEQRVQELEARIAAIESLLALPHIPGPGSAPTAPVGASAAVAQDVIERQRYRIAHLVAAYRRKCEEVENLRRQLETVSGK